MIANYDIDQGLAKCLTEVGKVDARALETLNTIQAGGDAGRTEYAFWLKAYKQFEKTRAEARERFGLCVNCA